MSKQKLSGRVGMFFLAGLSVLFFVYGTSFGAAEDYPSRPITVTLGNPPGAGMSACAQFFAEYAKKYLPNPQPVMINYKPGATQTIAASYVLSQPADGYNIFWGSGDLIGKLVQDAHKFSFKREDFLPIGIIGTSPHALTVNRKSPYKSLEDFIDYAKKNPGKLTFGSAGVGSYIHLNGEVFQLRCGVKLDHIPFAGGAEAITALLGGHIDCCFGSIVTAGPHLGAGGGLRALAIFTPERWSSYPDVPTSFERGYNIERGSIYYMAVAKGTPQPVLNTLVEVFKRTADDPQLKAAISKTGAIPVNWGPEETEKKLTELFELTRDVMKNAGLLK
jgi:tripartite-type tricarboxylate transporter receptor subunit TctC